MIRRFAAIIRSQPVYQRSRWCIHPVNAPSFIARHPKTRSDTLRQCPVSFKISVKLADLFLGKPAAGITRKQFQPVNILRGQLSSFSIGQGKCCANIMKQKIIVFYNRQNEMRAV